MSHLHYCWLQVLQVCVFSDTIPQLCVESYTYTHNTACTHEKLKINPKLNESKSKQISIGFTRLR